MTSISQRIDVLLARRLPVMVCAHVHSLYSKSTQFMLTEICDEAVVISFIYLSRDVLGICDVIV